jgi:2-polyprenyl-6-methoxyphenol hydroxylase-like FAD-dependent oxidoreductase
MAMPSTWFIAIDPRGVFTFAALHDCAPADPAQWTFMVLLTWPADEPDEQAALARDSDRLLDKIRAMAEPLAFPFDAMVRGIPRGTKSGYTAELNYWLTKPWDGRGGRVTLAGDAAHTMTFRASAFVRLHQPFWHRVVTDLRRMSQTVAKASETPSRTRPSCRRTCAP